MAEQTVDKSGYTMSKLTQTTNPTVPTKNNNNVGVNTASETIVSQTNTLTSEGQRASLASGGAGGITTTTYSSGRVSHGSGRGDTYNERTGQLELNRADAEKQAKAQEQARSVAPSTPESNIIGAPQQPDYNKLNYAPNTPERQALLESTYEAQSGYLFGRAYSELPAEQQATVRQSALSGDSYYRQAIKTEARIKTGYSKGEPYLDYLTGGQFASYMRKEGYDIRSEKKIDTSVPSVSETKPSTVKPKDLDTGQSTDMSLVKNEPYVTKPKQYSSVEVSQVGELSIIAPKGYRQSWSDALARKKPTDYVDISKKVSLVKEYYGVEGKATVVVVPFDKFKSEDTVVISQGTENIAKGTKLEATTTSIVSVPTGDILAPRKEITMTTTKPTEVESGKIVKNIVIPVSMLANVKEVSKTTEKTMTMTTGEYAGQEVIATTTTKSLEGIDKLSVSSRYEDIKFKEPKKELQAEAYKVPSWSSAVYDVKEDLTKSTTATAKGMDIELKEKIGIDIPIFETFRDVAMFVPEAGAQLISYKLASAETIQGKGGKGTATQNIIDPVFSTVGKIEIALDTTPKELRKAKYQQEEQFVIEQAVPTLISTEMMAVAPLLSGAGGTIAKSSEKILVSYGTAKITEGTLKREALPLIVSGAYGLSKGEGDIGKSIKYGATMYGELKVGGWALGNLAKESQVKQKLVSEDVRTNAPDVWIRKSPTGDSLLAYREVGAGEFKITWQGKEIIAKPYAEADYWLAGTEGKSAVSGGYLKTGDYSYATRMTYGDTGMALRELKVSPDGIALTKYGVDAKLVKTVPAGYEIMGIKGGIGSYPRPSGNVYEMILTPQEYAYIGTKPTVKYTPEIWSADVQAGGITGQSGNIRLKLKGAEIRGLDKLPEGKIVDTTSFIEGYGVEPTSPKLVSISKGVREMPSNIFRLEYYGEQATITKGFGKSFPFRGEVLAEMPKTEVKAPNVLGQAPKGRFEPVDIQKTGINFPEQGISGVPKGYGERTIVKPTVKTAPFKGVVSKAPTYNIADYDVPQGSMAMIQDTAQVSIQKISLKGITATAKGEILQGLKVKAFEEIDLGAKFRPFALEGVKVKQQEITTYKPAILPETQLKTKTKQDVFITPKVLPDIKPDVKIIEEQKYIYDIPPYTRTTVITKTIFDEPIKPETKPPSEITKEYIGILPPFIPNFGFPSDIGAGGNGKVRKFSGKTRGLIYASLGKYPKLGKSPKIGKKGGF